MKKDKIQETLVFAGEDVATVRELIAVARYLLSNYPALYLEATEAVEEETQDH